MRLIASLTGLVLLQALLQLEAGPAVYAALLASLVLALGFQPAAIGVFAALAYLGPPGHWNLWLFVLPLLALPGVPLQAVAAVFSIVLAGTGLFDLNFLLLALAALPWIPRLGWVAPAGSVAALLAGGLPLMGLQAFVLSLAFLELEGAQDLRQS